MSFREVGVRTEEYFCDLIKSEFPNYLYLDSWYDFELSGVKVELKSCLFRSRNGHRKVSYSNHSEFNYNFIFGRFDFTDPDTRQRYVDEDVWIAFIVRSKDDLMFLGFVHSRDLVIKRYVRMIDVLRANPLSIAEFKKRIS